MTESCGPSCAFRFTYAAAAVVGIGLVRPVVGQGPEVSALGVVLFAGLLGLSVLEWRTHPVKLWWRWLVAVSAGTALVSFVGVALVVQFLSGALYTVAYLLVLVGAFRYIPRLASATALAPDDSVEPLL